MSSLTKGFLFWSEIGYICDMVKSLREEYAQNSRLVRKCDDIIHRIEQIPETVSIFTKHFARNCM